MPSVVKTNIQASVNGSSLDFLAVAKQLYREGGAGIFWEGLGPKVSNVIVVCDRSV